MRDKNKQKNILLYSKLSQQFFTLILSAAVLIAGTAAWFSQNRQMTTNDIQMNAVGIPSLKITARQDAVYDALTYSEVVNNSDDGSRVFYLLIDNNIEKISPGVSGSFKFWATTDNASSIFITPKICPGGIVTEKDINQNVTSYTLANEYRENITDLQIREKAVNYLQGHILLFTEYEDGVYSGWLNPDSNNVLLNDFSDNQTHEITIYWVWVNSYTNLYLSDSLINQESQQQIMNWINSDETYADTYLFDKRNNTVANPSNTLLNHYYDFADEDIGVCISHIHFNITFKL